MEDFRVWLANRIKELDYSPSEFARAAHKAPAVITRILNGERKPSNETLVAIAPILGMHPIDLAVQAGEFPPDPHRDETVATLNYQYANSPSAVREKVSEYMRLHYESNRSGSPDADEAPQVDR